MKILITGGTGLLGSNLIKILEKDHQVFAPTRNYLDITDYTSVELTGLGSFPTADTGL